MDKPKGEMPFLDHLEELRWRIIWSLVAVVVGTGAGIWAVLRFDVIGLVEAPLLAAMAEIVMAYEMREWLAATLDRRRAREVRG